MAHRRYRRKVHRPRIRRRTRVPRGMNPLKGVHSFKQTYFPSAGNFQLTGGNGNYNAANGVLTGNLNAAAGDQAWTLRFTLSDLPQNVSLASIFDTYKIKRVVVKFIPQINSLTSVSSAATALVANQQFMSTVIDYDDSNAILTYNNLLEYETFRETPTYRTHKRSLVPKISMLAYKTSGTTIGYVQKSKQWLDAANADIEHYGLKGYHIANANMIQQQWKVYVTMYVDFKQVR